MSSVQFEIAPSYIASFKRYRKVQGGGVIPVRRMDTGELGALLICHIPSLRKWSHIIEKVKWVICCNCPYPDKSPFGYANKFSPVKTRLTSNILEVNLVLEEDLDECEESMYPTEADLADLDEQMFCLR